MPHYNYMCSSHKSMKEANSSRNQRVCQSVTHLSRLYLQPGGNFSNSEFRGSARTNWAFFKVLALYKLWRSIRVQCVILQPTLCSLLLF